MADGPSAALDVGALLDGPRLPLGNERARARQELLSASQPALAYLCARVAAEDVAALRVLRDGRTQVHALLTPRAAARTGVLALADHPPYRPARESEPGLSQALRASAAMGLALVDDADRAPEELAVGVRWLRHSWTVLPSADGSASALLDRVLSGPGPGAAAGHPARIRRLVEGLGAEDRDLALPVLLRLLTLDGALPGLRPVASAGVLFDGGNTGVRGTLGVAVLPEGPPALVPDPRTMSGFRAEEKFHGSLRNAWAAAGGKIRGTVLWSLTDNEGVTAMVSDSSLGCAFAVLLDEVRKQGGGRVRRAVAVRRINPRTALVGAVDGSPEGRLVGVGGYEQKLRVAANGQTVVLPEDDLPKAGEVWEDDRAALLKGAGTVAEAAKAARAPDLRALVRSGASAIAVLVALVLVVGSTAYWFWDRGRERERRALAADLVAEALTRRATEPRLAGLLALAGQRIDPGTPNAEQAMRDVLETNSGLRLAWKASPGSVDSVAVDDERHRVYTTGDDPYLKSWDLRTGKALGRVPGRVGGLVYSPEAGLLAAGAEDGIRLYSAQGPVPEPIATLPEPSCAGPDTHRVATAFTERGGRLVEVRNDGTIAQFDVLTREESDCRRAGPGGSSRARWRVVDAALAPAPWHSGRLPGEERAVLLLDENRVVSVGLDTHGVESEIGSEDVPGRASAVGADDELVVLATPRGVFAWDRQRKRPLDYPVGGLADPPKVMIEHNGSVVVAGDAGTALVPLGTGGSAASSRGLERPRGGAAGAAAVGELFTVVAAGRDGWVGVLDRRPGPLGMLPGEASSTATFDADGSLLLTDVSGNLSHGLRRVRPDPLAYQRNPATAEYPVLTEYRSKGHYINDAASSPAYVAAAGQLGGAAKIVVWRRDGTLLQGLEPPGADRGTASGAHRIAVGVGFVPGEDLLVARHVDGPLYLWSTRTWKPVGTIPLGASEGLGLTLHESRPLALALERPGADDARLVLVDLVTRTTRAVDAPGVHRFAWSRDGSRVALLGLDNTVRLLDADLRDTGAPLRLTGAVNAPSSIALSPDGGRVAVGYADRVTVRDTATGDLALPELRVSGADGIIHLRWSPDGEVLAGITRTSRGREGDRPPGPVELWRVGTVDWGEVLCRWTGSGLTPEEWNEHVGPTEDYTDLCEEKK
ncbi:WD40 repeat domain-containing protein [Streptomyces bikiniensis]|uniref:WD40 repeat domain-containing protein n=1 Tax=Streptomyces bikiniensis TaxID=1896 RepID=UPI0004BED5BF|nr:WD40 repeat domain-containing protein [Streptomyces bikiniensis]